jgi:uncharacterized RmlC-like cupin family protein
MSGAVSDVSPRQDAFWWQGSLMTIKARAEDTGGALGLVEARFVLEGQIRFRQGQDEFVAGPGTWVWGPRGVPHAFKVESESARALVIVTPGGFERMFEEGGVPATDASDPPEQEYDPDAATAISTRFGFEVVGPQLT